MDWSPPRAILSRFATGSRGSLIDYEVPGTGRDATDTTRGEILASLDMTCGNAACTRSAAAATGHGTKTRRRSRVRVRGVEGLRVWTPVGHADDPLGQHQRPVVMGQAGLAADITGGADVRSEGAGMLRASKTVTQRITEALCAGGEERALRIA